jgi:hypothetical protein
MPGRASDEQTPVTFYTCGVCRLYQAELVDIHMQKLMSIYIFFTGCITRLGSQVNFLINQDIGKDLPGQQ